MNEDIKAILKRKKRGIDCTEEESAGIKIFLKNLFFRAKRGKLYPFSFVEDIEGIENEFPIEFGEVMDEMNR